MGDIQVRREPSPQPPSDRWRRWRARAMRGLIVMGAAMAGHPIQPWELAESWPDDEERPRPE